MHMVPVAVLPEPSEKESIMGVMVSDARRGGGFHFPSHNDATGSMNSVSDVRGGTVCACLGLSGHCGSFSSLEAFLVSYTLLTLPKMEIGAGVSFKECSSFAPLILP